MSRPLVFLFPGQSSRDADMFTRARVVDPETTALADFERLAGRPFDGTFESNTDVQLAVHLVTRVHRQRLAREGLHPVASAGLSLGEYAHLIQIGALDEDDADTLIAARGRCYDAGPDGAMVAITPGALDEVEGVLAAVRTEHGIDAADLAVANHNSARQVVIAGSRCAVDLAVEALERDLFAMTKEIESRVPMHVDRFAPVANAFSVALAAISWKTPSTTWWSNVTGGPIEDPTRDTIVQTMRAHVHRRVRWAALLDALAEAHPRAVLLEVGPGRVLTGLHAKACRRRDLVALALDGRGTEIDIDKKLQEVRDACT